MKELFSDLYKLILRFSIALITAMRLLALGGVLSTFYEELGLKGMLSLQGGILLGKIIVLFISCIMLILGFKTRFSALLIAIFAFLLLANNLNYDFSLFLRDESNTWIFETPLLFLIIAINIYFLGAGRFSLDYFKKRK